MKQSEIIRKAMVENGIGTIKELSILTGLSQNQLYKITNHNNVNITAKTAKKLNETLKLNLIGTEKQTNDNSIGYKIYKLRTDRNISAEELSVIADISISTVGTLERNIYVPSKLTIKKLAKAFKMKQYELRKLLFDN